MVKLIRLMSDGDGIFKSAFDNDIIIKEQSKIALLNLTFKTDVDALTINDNNNAVEQQTDISSVHTIGVDRMAPTTYRRSNMDELSNDLNNTLNNTLTIPDGPLAGNQNDVSSMFAVYGGGSSTGGDPTRDGNFKIALRYAPFINPTVGDQGIQGYPTEQSAVWSTDVEITHAGAGNVKLTQITKEGSKGPTIDSLSRVETVEQHFFCRGSGLLTLRIADSVTNGSGLEDNGGCLGITNISLPTLAITDEIPLANMIVQLRYNRPGESYRYIVNGGVEQDSGIKPQQVAMLAHPNLADHDILFIQVDGQDYEFGVFQIVAGVATKHVFSTTAVTYIGTGKTNAFDQPYMTLRGAKTDIMFDSYNFSIDPWVNEPAGTPNGPNDNWEITTASGTSGLDNGYRASLAGGLADVLTEIWDEPNRGRWGSQLEAELTLHNDVWLTLGFSQVSQSDSYTSLYEVLSGGTNPKFTAIWKAESEGQLVASDNYIVLSDTLTLDSYDASQFEYGVWDGNSVAGGEKRGRRQNILMTIPVNDNTNGLVEFQTNTPIFIDINNAKGQNVRNLNFRVLKKDFSPIYSRQATMTILIED